MKLALALLVASFVMAGCTGSGGDGSVPEKDSEGRYVIHMTASKQFTPMSANVPANATVIWVNDSSVPHDVTAHDDSWNSPLITTEGGSYERTFEAAGEYDYHCTLHDGMTGTLHVG